MYRHIQFGFQKSNGKIFIKIFRAIIQIKQVFLCVIDIISYKGSLWLSIYVLFVYFFLAFFSNNSITFHFYKIRSIFSIRRQEFVKNLFLSIIIFWLSYETLCFNKKNLLHERIFCMLFNKCHVAAIRTECRIGVTNNNQVKSGVFPINLFRRILLLRNQLMIYFVVNIDCWFCVIWKLWRVFKMEQKH